VGVPQGSTLGPFLFLLFINDIENEVLNSIQLFADDTSLYCVVEDQTSTAESLNEDLACIHQWSSDWGITFNATKTKSMLFSRNKMANLPPLFFNGTMLEKSKSQSILLSLLTQMVNGIIILMKYILKLVEELTF
jgi:hypothetical protein